MFKFLKRLRSLEEELGVSYNQDDNYHNRTASGTLERIYKRLEKIEDHLAKKDKTFEKDRYPF